MLEVKLKDMLEFLSFIIVIFISFYILTKIKSEHVTSTYYQSWYLVFEFIFNVTYFHRVIDIYCMHSYLVDQTLNILFRVVS